MHQNNNYFSRFITRLQQSYHLLKHPSHWQTLQTEAFPAKAIYVNLILPLAVLAEIPHTIFTGINGDLIFALAILAVNVLIYFILIFFCAFILKIVAEASQNKKHSHKIFAALPYCFVPFFISKFLAAAITNFVPFPFFGFQWILPLAGIILTVYLFAGILKYLLEFSYEHKVITVALFVIVILFFWWNLFALEEWIIYAIGPYIP